MQSHYRISAARSVTKNTKTGSKTHEGGHTDKHKHINTRLQCKQKMNSIFDLII